MATPPRPAAARAGFSLVELLVVIAILAMLMALLVPGVQGVRELGRRTACSNNLHQIGVAAIAHSARMQHFPTGGCDGSTLPSVGAGADWRQSGGWGYTILPDLDMQTAYDSPSTDTPVPSFVCATRRGTSIGPGSIVMTDYAGNRGAWSSSAGVTTFGWELPGIPSKPADAQGWAAVAQTLNSSQAVPGTGASVPTGGIIFAGSSLQPVRIRDGAEKTYLFAEKYVPKSEYDSGTWDGYNKCAFVGDSPDTLRAGHRQPASDSAAFSAGMEGGFGGPHPGVFLAVMCDSSVKVITLDIDAAVHFLLASRADLQNVQVPE